ncbi:MAG TPA: hypothetical protein VGX23_33615 [Actinocrinis sp.]|nr:hypothetical protein [Actinocrinis sp.]
MKAALVCVGLAVVARHPALTFVLTSGLGAVVAGQAAYIIRAARKAMKP